MSGGRVAVRLPCRAGGSAVLPYLIFVPWVARHGFVRPVFFRLPFASGSAALFAAAVFLLWQQVAARRLGMARRWLPPLLVTSVGLCCALLLFLAMRERAVAQADE